MKKLLILTLLLASCSTENIETKLITVDTVQVEDVIVTDSTQSVSDSVVLRMTNLLVTTEGAKEKVKEIKAIKKENVSLKQELVETKAELQTLQGLVDSIPTKKVKKTFLQKVISTITKDTLK